MYWFWLSLIPLVPAAMVTFYYATGRKFDSNGVRLHYWDEGRGAPVILVHGFAADSFINWRVPGIVRILRRQYRVISLDMRGHGRSQKPIDPQAYGEELVEDIRRLMDHLDIQKAHLVGYSMGGFITLAFTRQYPQRLLSACAGGAGWFPQGEYPEVLYTLPAALDSGQGHLPILEFFESNRGPIGRLRVRIANLVVCLYNPNMGAMARCFESLATLSATEDEIRSNTVPVFCFAGDCDPLKVAAENLIGKGSHLETLFVPGGDHTTTLAWRPYRMLALRRMLDFLKRHTPVAETA